MMEEMPNVYRNVRLAYVDTDMSDLVDTYDIEMVQTLIVLHPECSEKSIVKKVGIKPEELTSMVE